MFATFLYGICDSYAVLQNIVPTTTFGLRPVRRATSKIQAVGIVIPVRNESDTIAQCIQNIFAAHSHSGWRNSLWIVVVADACTDATAKVARNALGAFGEVLEVAARSLQTAHQIGVSTVTDHFRHVPRHALLLTSTDAGTRLRRDWIDTKLQW
jgi:cellulose synthase/poly-beta-1,6-N-acetylglucosamine synthase-like glycosyltransferase